MNANTTTTDISKSTAATLGFARQAQAAAAATGDAAAITAAADVIAAVATLDADPTYDNADAALVHAVITYKVAAATGNQVAISKAADVIFAASAIAAALDDADDFQTAADRRDFRQQAMTIADGADMTSYKRSAVAAQRKA